MTGTDRPVIPAERVNNLGYWTIDDQFRIEEACVAAAGLGGAGGMVVEMLGRCGVRAWRLADPDASERSNIGRQAGATLETVGQPKVDITEAALRSVNRHVNVQRFCEGVTPQNLAEFLNGVDVVLDAIAFEAAWLSVLLGRRARDRGVAMVTSIEVGDGCQYTAFRPSPSCYEETVEAYFGVPLDDPADPSMEIDVTALLTYAPPSFPRGLLQAVGDGRVETPAHSIGVARNASAVARVVRELIWHPTADHSFWYPMVVVDDPDPMVGTFLVHHDDRAETLAASLELVEKKSGPPQFSPIDEYDVA